LISNNLYVKEYRMTAKEKGNELYNKFEDSIIGLEGDEWYNSAKQCALIACDEVLGYMGADRGTEFWVEVKKEIEKI
jgi:hypothetical protein